MKKLLTKKFDKKKLFIYITVISVIYVISYIFLSLSGEYYISMTGEIRNSAGFALIDCQEWGPKFLAFDVYKDVSGRLALRGWNIGGLIYSPLIVIDRKFWHKTIYYDQEFKERQKPPSRLGG